MPKAESKLGYAAVELGFVWNPVQDQFDRGIAELAACVEAHGDARVPFEHSTARGFKLGNWCSNLRQGSAS